MCIIGYRQVSTCRPAHVRVQGSMLAIAAALCFLLVTFGVPNVGLLALQFVFPWAPWTVRR